MTRFITDFRLMFSMISDSLTGRYKRWPLRTYLALIVGIVYTVSPVDFLPDWILPFFAGFIDDAGVIGLCWLWIQKDLAPYKVWREEKPREVEFTEE